MSAQRCEDCWNYNYDEEADEYYCRMDLDEDEYYRAFARKDSRCPYFLQADDYYLPRHQ